MTVSSDKYKKIRSYFRYIPAVTVFLILFIFIFQMIVYINMDVAPSFTDAHYLRTLDYLDYFSNSSQKNIPTHEYPPLTYFVGFIFLRILGISLKSARLSLIVFAVIYILSMYGIGKELGDEVSGIAVCALSVSSPHILLFSRMFFLDFPQTAMTALVFYLILKSDYYRNSLFSILVGVMLGLSMLTKWSTIFFIFLPLVWFVVPSLISILKSVLLSGKNEDKNLPPSEGANRDHPAHSGDIISLSGGANNTPSAHSGDIISPLSEKANNFPPACEGELKGGQNRRITYGREPNLHNKSIINFIIICLLSLLIFTPWILYNLNAVRTKVFLDFTHYHKDVPRTFFSALTFLKFSFNYAVVFVIIGLVYIFIKRKDIFRNIILPLNIIFSLLIILKTGYPHSRYILSFVIFMAALGGWWVCYAGKIGKVLTIFIVILSLISMTGWLIFPDESPLQEIDTRPCLYDTTSSSRMDLVVTNMLPLTVQGPNKNKYDIKSVLNILKESLDSEMDGREHILLKIDPGGKIGDHEFVDFLAIEFRKNNIPLDTSRFWGYNQFIDVSRWNAEMKRDLSDVERILVKHPTDQSINLVISKLKDIHGGVAPRVVRRDLPQNISVTLILFRDEDR